MNTIVDLPIILKTDYVIIGNGLKEVTAATRWTAKGKEVLIITEETYLLSDICDGKYISYIHPDRIKKKTEEICKQKGIKLLYQTGAIDTIEDKGSMYLRVCGKSGVYGIQCEEIIKLSNNRQKDSFHLHILQGPKLQDEILLEDPSLGKIFDISILPGSFSSDHSVLEIRLKNNSNQERETQYGENSIVKWKEKCLEVYSWLKANYEGFEDAIPGRFAPDIYSSSYDYRKEYKKGIKIADDFPNHNHNQNHNHNKDYDKPNDLNKVSKISKIKDVKGIDIKDKNINNKNIRDIDLKDKDIEVLAHNTEIKLRNYNTISSTKPSISKTKEYDLIIVGGGTAGVMAAYHASKNGLNTVLIELNKELGGTSTVGGVSAYWFGKRYKDVEEVDERVNQEYERYSIPRKPGTWGKHDDWNPGIKSMVLEKMCLETGVDLVFTTLSFAAVKEKGNDRISGVISKSIEGLIYYKGKYIVDGTGDGDIAALAGAKTIYGSDRDYITYWASLAQYSSPADYKNNFSSNVIVSDPLDYTRFIIDARLKGDDTYDHGSYVSPRESRHVIGKYIINLQDIINFKTYYDGIYTCFSNYDPKGKLDSDMVYGGYLPPQVSIQVPLRSLLPIRDDGSQIKGLLVIGKAISCTHGAFPSIRMQADLLHQGAVVGLILSLAVKEDKEPDQLNMDKLKSLISNYTDDPLTLPSNTRTLEEAIQKASHKDRTHYVDLSFTEEVTNWEPPLQIVSADKKEALHLLKKAYSDLISKFALNTEININDKKDLLNTNYKKEFFNNNDKNEVFNNNDKNQTLYIKDIYKSPEYKDLLVYSRYLLWFGDDSGTYLILKLIKDILESTPGLPARKASTLCVQLLPDHGVMPELVYLLNFLAWSKEGDIVEPFKEILLRLKADERDYMDNKKGIYHYIETFAYVSERTGLMDFVPMLEDLCEFREFKEVMTNPDPSSLLTERLQILLLSLYRAQARLAQVEGYKGLIKMLSARSLAISASASKELENLSGESYGLSSDKWKNWLKNNKDNLHKELINTRVW